MSFTVKFDGFEQQIKGVEKQAADMFADMVHTLWEELVGNTPHDTYRAQNSWQVLGRYQRTHSTPPGEYGPPTFPGMPPNERLGVVRIASDVDYMVYLNHGHSKQAPAMFVERAIDKVTRLYR